MKVLLALFFAAFFVNLMKKSLTTRFGQNSEVDPYFLRRKAGSL